MIFNAEKEIKNIKLSNIEGCITCKYFLGLGSFEKRRAVLDGKKQEAEQDLNNFDYIVNEAVSQIEGWCRRYPPVVDKQPDVYGGAWCGEFKRHPDL